MKNYKYLFFFIFIISITTKLYYISNYESSIDDNIILQSILNQKNRTNINNLKSKIYDTTKTTYNSFGKKILRAYDVKYDINNITKPINNLIQFIIVPFKTTYSPFQYLFVPYFINSNYTISQNLFGGRFISFIFSIITLLLFFKLLFTYFINKFDFGLTYILILFSFSQEFNIYSMHMSSYMAGLFGVLLLTYISINYIKENYINNYKISFFYGIIIGLLLLLQYQVLYFIIPFLLTISYFYFNKHNIKSLLFLFFGFSVIFTPIYLIFLTKHINHVSDHWAHGPMLKYYYPNELHLHFKKILYTFYFFIKNFYLLIYNLLSFTNYKIITVFLTFLNIFFIIKGLLFLRCEKIYNILYIYIKMFTITYLILIITGRITFSPSRHSLILLPFLFFLIYLGIRSYNFKSNYSIISIYILFFIMLISNIRYNNDHIEPYIKEGNFKKLYYNKQQNNFITIDFLPFVILNNINFKKILYYNNDTSEIFLTNKANFDINKTISFISNKYELKMNIINSYKYLYGNNVQFNYKIKDSTILYTKRSDEINEDFAIKDSVFFYNIITTKY